MSTFTDYSAATYTANARTRIMCDAITALYALESRLEKGKLSEIVYTDAASMNIIAYADQLHHMPNKFWDELELEDYATAEILVRMRNNLAHSYHVITPDFDLIHMVATTDIPRIHWCVMNFYEENDLMNNRMAYQTDRRSKHMFRLNDEAVKRQYGFPSKYTEIVSENRKKRW